MAGFYPDVPGHRFAYHLDGTVGFVANHAFTTLHTDPTISQVNMDRLNSPIYTSFLYYYESIGFIFPESRVVTGYAMRFSHVSSFMGMEFSINTSNGIDGDWTNIGHANRLIMEVGSIVDYRLAINTIDPIEAKAVRFRYLGNSDKYNIHIYGHISESQDIEYLKLWHPTLDEELSGHYFDFAEIYHGANRPSRPFRVKNISSSKDASSVSLAKIESPNSVMFSSNNAEFLPSLNIGDIPADSVSDLVYLKFDPGVDVLGLGETIIEISAESWT